MAKTSKQNKRSKIVITGAAGLVGQNLISCLKEIEKYEIVAIDKQSFDGTTLCLQHPHVNVVTSDLSKKGPWQEHFSGASIVIMCHAQIGGLREQSFYKNNVAATMKTLEAARFAQVPYLIHISSSAVVSKAQDFYASSKRAQESLVLNCGIPACILRPTLMYGLFDRKHLGWLAKFMRRSPIFPVPGYGRFLRQPLYVRDFCEIIMSCIMEPRANRIFNISGLEKIDYIDLIRLIKNAVKARTLVLRVPYALFWLMIKMQNVLTANPTFTTQQLEALTTPDVFEIIDWPRIFGVNATPLHTGIIETFSDSMISDWALEA